LPTAQRLTILKRLCLTDRLPPAQADALLAYLAAGSAGEPQARVWRLHQLSLLLALDRQTELETLLARWTHDDPAEPTWHIAFGYLLATQNQPTGTALDVLTQLREDLVTQYAASGPKPLADTPDQAAMINLASVLLDLDTALTK
jgi:hypothetical protein